MRLKLSNTETLQCGDVLMHDISDDKNNTLFEENTIYIVKDINNEAVVMNKTLIERDRLKYSEISIPRAEFESAKWYFR